MAPADIQSYGRTTGDNQHYWGAGNKRQKHGEEEKGGERDAHAGKVAEDMELELGNIGGGRGGEQEPSVEGKSSK